MSEDQEIKIGLTCSDDANNLEIPNGSEWKNGDECLYDGSDYIFIGMTPTFNDVSCIIFSAINGIEHVSVNKLRKPETPEQREVRDRLEAAYDLYCIYKNEIEMPKMSFNSFICAEQKNMNAWLAIVDKTKYRVTK